MTFPPEPLIQIQNNFTELFLMMASTKSAQTVLLGLIQGRQSSRWDMPLNDIFPWTTSIPHLLSFHLSPHLVLQRQLSVHWQKIKQNWWLSRKTQYLCTHRLGLGNALGEVHLIFSPMPNQTAHDFKTITAYWREPITLCLLALNFVVCCWTLRTVWTQIRPTERLVWCESILFDTLIVFPKELFEVNFEKKSAAASWQ